MSFLARRNSLPAMTPSSGEKFKKKAIDPRRFYTAMVVIPLLYAGIAYSPPWLFALFVGGTVLVALWEYLSFYFGSTGSFHAKLMACLGSVGILYAINENIFPVFQVVALGTTLLILAGFSLNPHQMRQRLPRGAAYLFGVFYVTLLFGHFILLRNMDHGVAIIFFVLIVTWLADTGGYVFGMAWGRHPLAPVLSPNKTIEGFVGGILFSMAGAAICHAWFFSLVTLGQSVFVGSLLAVSGTLGDLTESAIKRSVKVKDSGSLIPGHGGVLDRIDSLLLSAPAFYYYALFTGLHS